METLPCCQLCGAQPIAYELVHKDEWVPVCAGCTFNEVMEVMA